jgi:hypothetical protein
MDDTYYLKKIQFTKTIDKTINYNNLYFNCTGDEFYCLEDYVKGTFNGLHADELVEIYKVSLYTRKKTYEKIDKNKIVHKRRCISSLSKEPNENEILYADEQIIGLYRKENEEFVYMKNSYCDKTTYIIFDKKPFKTNNTFLDLF